MSDAPGRKPVLERVSEAVARTWPEIEMPIDVFVSLGTRLVATLVKATKRASDESELEPALE